MRILENFGNSKECWIILKKFEELEIAKVKFLEINKYLH